MTFTTIIKRTLVATALLSLALIVAGTANAKAYTAPGTPAFNIYTDVPYGVGNEADFVRLRNSTGDPTVPAVTTNFVDPFNDDCKTGDMYDVRTYIHNGADPTGNDNGNGVAVAHNVNVAMTAPLNTTAKSFVFGSTVSGKDRDDNSLTTVHDTGTLNCASNVRLELVPTSVHVYSRTLGWNGAPDNAVNGNLSVGSRTVGSGVQWACWDDRIQVVYTVRVVEVPPAPQYSCDLLSVTKLDNRKYKFVVKYTAKNGATLKDITFDYGDGNKGTDTTHTFAKDGTYNVVATVNVMVNGQMKSVSSDACAKPVTVTKENCTVPGKENYPKDAPECKVCDVNPNLPYDSPDCVHTLPNTGPGSVAGIFAAVTAAGAMAHRYITRRRFNV